MSLAEAFRKPRERPISRAQALLNLVMNARDAMPRGGTLRLHATTLRVEDEGLVRDDARDVLELERKVLRRSETT